MSIIRNEADGYPVIRCDADGCEVDAPPASVIMKGRGLNNMGWSCWGGTHLCPKHVDHDEARQMETARIAAQPALGSRHDG